MGVGARDLFGNALRVLAAALESVAARWGVLGRLTVLTLLEVVLEKGSEFGGIQVKEETDSAKSFILIPYLARVEYCVNKVRLPFEAFYGRFLGT